MRDQGSTSSGRAQLSARLAISASSNREVMPVATPLFPAFSRAEGSAASRAARLASMESKAPALIRDSHTRRLAFCRSVALRAWKTSLNPPSLARAARIASRAASPRPLDGGEAEADLAWAR